jgi:RNA polymerase sigma factor (sigma-70 family)
VLKLLRGRNERAETGSGRLPRVVDDLAGLVTRYRSGETGALTTLLSTLGPSVLQMVRRTLGAGDPDVEDVFQESLIAIVRALPSFRGECSTRHFGCRVATLTALKARRRKHAGIRVDLIETDDGPLDPTDESDCALATCRRQILRRLLDELPDVQAEALVLHHITGLTVDEIADASGAAMETVRSRLRLAKAALRARIEADPSMLELLEDSP